MTQAEVICFTERDKHEKLFEELTYGQLFMFGDFIGIKIQDSDYDLYNITKQSLGYLSDTASVINIPCIRITGGIIEEKNDFHLEVVSYKTEAAFIKSFTGISLKTFKVVKELYKYSVYAKNFYIYSANLLGFYTKPFKAILIGSTFYTRYECKEKKCIKISPNEAFSFDEKVIFDVPQSVPCTSLKNYTLNTVFINNEPNVSMGNNKYLNLVTLEQKTMTPIKEEPKQIILNTTNISYV